MVNPLAFSRSGTPEKPAKGKRRPRGKISCAGRAVLLSAAGRKNWSDTGCAGVTGSAARTETGTARTDNSSNFAP